MERYQIKQWEAKYYDCTTKTWVAGTLRLKESSIDFSVADSTDYAYVCLYPNIVDVRKASSMLIFKALVVRCTSDEDHWFSSLSSRDYVFNLIEHFWHNCLVSPSSLQARSNSESHATSLGQELLQITGDSQKTLGQASEALSCQGEQLSHATALMVDLHDDLDVADPIIRSLDSWLGRWSMPNRREPSEVISRTAAPVIREFPVLFSEGSSSNLCISQGYVQISRDGLTIQDSSRVTAGHLRGRQISDIRVTTPWQVVVTGVKLGEPDRSYSLMSAQMPVALQTLERFYRYKLQFAELPPDVSMHTQHEGTAPDTVLLSDNHDHSEFKPSDVDKQQRQMSSGQSRHRHVSDDEVAQLSEMLNSMKLTALGVHSEQERQAETISELTESVDNANIRLQAANRTIKRML